MLTPLTHILNSNRTQTDAATIKQKRLDCQYRLTSKVHFVRPYQVPTFLVPIRLEVWASAPLKFNDILMATIVGSIYFPLFFLFPKFRS